MKFNAGINERLPGNNGRKTILFQLFDWYRTELETRRHKYKLRSKVSCHLHLKKGILRITGLLACLLHYIYLVSIIHLTNCSGDGTQ
jgi:hypothetical protein